MIEEIRIRKLVNGYTVRVYDAATGDSEERYIAAASTVVERIATLLASQAPGGPSTSSGEEPR